MYRECGSSKEKVDDVRIDEVSRAGSVRSPLYILLYDSLLLSLAHVSLTHTSSIWNFPRPDFYFHSSLARYRAMPRAGHGRC